MFTIRDASGDLGIETARALLEEYAGALGFGLEFQRFEQELDGLPGDYSPPRGCILLAWENGRAVGCVAMRPMSETVCEMKRLYVRPSQRCRGLGRALAEELIARARLAGYGTMRLDTVSTMKAANVLYESLGFQQTEAYRHNPIEGARFFELALRRAPRLRSGKGR